MIDFIKKNKVAITVAAVIVAALVIAFISGGSLNGASESEAARSSTEPSVYSSQADNTKATAENEQIATFSAAASQAETTVQPTTAKNIELNSASDSHSQNSGESSANTEKSEKSAKGSGSAVKDKYNTEPVPNGKPKPVEPQEQTTADGKIYCTFSISCSTILDNMDKLDSDLAELIPSDGWILKPERVEVADGESVFDILLRVCKENNIHTEYSWTPIYNSSYIEGIANIYEFDCGELSGWQYAVNSWYPNYGCSRYVVQNGDVIEWNYTCNSGRDLK